jgi:hypothetical protein
MLLVSSELIPRVPRAGTPEPSADAAGLFDGCAWASTLCFALGAVPLTAMLVARNAGPFGAGAVAVFPFVVFGLVGIGIVAGVSIVVRLVRRTRPVLRTLASLGTFVAGAVCLAPDLAGLLGTAPPSEAGRTIAGITLVILAAVLVAPRSERTGALAFATAWVVLLGVASYSVWTEMEVDVAWVGPNSIDDSPGQFAFTATRSGTFEVRFGARSCSDGRVIATGRYAFLPAPGSSFGQPEVVELPPGILPLQRGDLVRACVRDGFAAATRAAEVVDPPSFWPRD